MFTLTAFQNCIQYQKKLLFQTASFHGDIFSCLSSCMRYFKSFKWPHPHGLLVAAGGFGCSHLVHAAVPLAGALRVDPQVGVQHVGTEAFVLHSGSCHARAQRRLQKVARQEHQDARARPSCQRLVGAGCVVPNPTLEFVEAQRGFTHRCCLEGGAGRVIPSLWGGRGVGGSAEDDQIRAAWMGSHPNARATEASCCTMKTQQEPFCSGRCECSGGGGRAPHHPHALLVSETFMKRHQELHNWTNIVKTSKAARARKCPECARDETLSSKVLARVEVLALTRFLAQSQQN